MRPVQTLTIVVGVLTTCALSSPTSSPRSQNTEITRRSPKLNSVTGRLSRYIWPRSDSDHQDAHIWKSRDDIARFESTPPQTQNRAHKKRFRDEPEKLWGNHFYVGGGFLKNATPTNSTLLGPNGQAENHPGKRLARRLASTLRARFRGKRDAKASPFDDPKLWKTNFYVGGGFIKEALPAANSTISTRPQSPAKPANPWKKLARGLAPSLRARNFFQKRDDDTKGWMTRFTGKHDPPAISEPSTALNVTAQQINDDILAEQARQANLNSSAIVHG